MLRVEPLVARHVVPRLRLRDPSAEVVEQAEARVERELELIAASDRPVVVGPWLSEVGIELLYWIPFLRRLVERFGLDPQRLVVVSRGGVASWYEGLRGSYVDLFDLLSPGAFRRSLEASWAEQEGQKQFSVGAVDRSILAAVGEAASVRDPLVLHPSLMFGLMSEYWRGRIPLDRVLPHLKIAALTPPVEPELAARLPERYSALRFYFRETFPDTPSNRRLVSRLVEGLLTEGPVVLLDTEVAVDDHVHVPLPRDADVLRPLLGADPAANLRLQSAVLAGADALVGTYGGLCYLANAYGVPACALVTPPATKLGLTHTAVARRLSRSGGGALSIVATTALETLIVGAP